MPYSISAKQLLDNFMGSEYNENWQEIPLLSNEDRLNKRLAFVDKLLGEDVNGDNAAECFGLNFWDREDGWTPFDETIKNPWLNFKKEDSLYGHPLSFKQLQRKLGKQNAIIAEWITKTVRLCHDLGEQFKFELQEVIPQYVATSKREWDIENTFGNKHYMNFIKKCSYQRIVCYIIGITMFSNHRNGIRKGTDFNKLWKVHFVQWQYMRHRQITPEQYNKIMIENIENSTFYY